MSLEVDVTVRAGDLEVVAAFDVASGETVALAGPNGAGKSTLLRAIAGLRPLAAGTVRLGGHVLEAAATGARVPAARRRMGVVFQEPLLFPHLSVRDNVAFAARVGGQDRTGARDHADAWLARLGIAQHATARPGELSGGEAQRVALARALAAAPGCLLLDEPMASLDVEARHRVRQELHRHLAAFGGPRLLITHDPLEIAALADRIVVLEDGRVVQEGTVAEVTARPRSAWAGRLAGVNLLRGNAREPGRIAVGTATVTTAEPAVGELLLAIAPSAVALYRGLPEGSPRNAWPMRVVSLDRHGDRVRVSLTGPFDLVAEVTPAAVSELGLAESGELWAVVKATEVDAYAA